MKFSVYAIVYTVDFHWEVDGKTFEFSIPGVELPATGGPGTRLFTILGTAMIAAAGLLLWMTRKSSLG